ncbi:hypothetical protein [Cryptosporangium sp. NPDC051539]|uniref:hypothetical protein n=1 Tax=Cryptosporangium sp. NPDC051539 TaxID=3363962 RepID=UPI0037910433
MRLSASFTEPVVETNRAERRAAARGRRVAESPRTTPVPGRGRNVVHDRSRYAVRRRG